MIAQAEYMVGIILALHHFLDSNFKMHQTHGGFYLEASRGTEMTNLRVILALNSSRGLVALVMCPKS